MPKPAGTIHVAFPWRFDYGVRKVSGNDYVWPHLVTDFAGPTFSRSDFDYVNGGVPGYTIECHSEESSAWVARLQPDVIVIYEASNNLSGEMREFAVKRGIISNRVKEVTSWPSRYSLLWYLVEKISGSWPRSACEKPGGASTSTRRDRVGIPTGVDGACSCRSADGEAGCRGDVLDPTSPRSNRRAADARVGLGAFLNALRDTGDDYRRLRSIERGHTRGGARDWRHADRGRGGHTGRCRRISRTRCISRSGSKAMAERISRALVRSNALRQIADAVKR